MISGLWNGVTGLNTFERALNTQSNNVTNSNTIAHKSDRITFEDLMYENRYGSGVTVQNVQKNFEQGGIQITDQALDIAIEGSGFFVVYDQINDETFYSRAGNLKMGTDGTLQAIDGKQIFGSSTTLTDTSSSDTNTQFTSEYSLYIASEPINAPTFNQTINARATDYTQSAEDSGTSGSGFKTSGSKIADIRALITDYNNKLDLYSGSPNATSTASVSQETEIAYTNFLTELQDGSDYVEVSIDGSLLRQYFDTDVQTTMNLFADRISAVAGLTGTVDTNGVVTISSLIPGEDYNITGAAINNSAPAINETTSPSTGSGIAMVNSSRDSLKTELENAGARFLELRHNISQTDADLTGIGSVQLRLDNLNISENVFGELSVEDGLIYSADGENKFLVGKLETAYFSNPEGLEPVGGTLFSQNELSGTAKNASNINELVSGAVELSNSSFSEGLVDLMLYQRAFEASSKSVTTADEFLRTAIQLKK